MGEGGREGERERKGKIGRGREDIAIYPSIHLPIRPSIVYLSKRQRQIDADWEELVAFWLSVGKSGSIYLSSLEGASRALGACGLRGPSVHRRRTTAPEE